VQPVFRGSPDIAVIAVILGYGVSQQAAANEFQFFFFEFGVQPVNIDNAYIGDAFYTKARDLLYQSLPRGIGQLFFDADFYSMHWQFPQHDLISLA